MSVITNSNIVMFSGVDFGKLPEYLHCPAYSKLLEDMHKRIEPIESYMFDDFMTINEFVVLKVFEEPAEAISVSFKYGYAKGFDKLTRCAIKF
ncbi:MAG: hypothetical protein HFE90_06065 [Firmicutes bacterium]|nr:hypothetical protein [Bacillota bacterium]